MSQGIYGDTTRDLYVAWHSRLGANSTIQHDMIQPLFNDLGLYPSKSQVVEMLHCARKCNNRQTDNHITFGEFCVFATELPRYYANHEKDPQQANWVPEMIELEHQAKMTS